MDVFPFKLPSRYEYSGERIEGGSGYIYVCRDNYLDRKVAVKVLRSITDVDALRREWGALRDVKSQHTAEIYDLVFARRSGMAGLVEEYVPGSSLEDYASGNISRQDYLATLWQLARGIADIHASYKIHRDIKPSNIRFDAENVLKILDFGLASDAAPDAETLAARGTRHYLGPEFYRTPPIKLTPAADAYAFGVTAWHLASKGSLPQELKAKPPKPEMVASLRSARKDLPADLAALLDSTLSVAPAKRPPMATVRDDLARHLLHGKHRATFGHDGKVTHLSAAGSITLRREPDSMVVNYDGLQFLVAAVNGDVYVNNVRVQAKAILEGSCVITLGHPAQGVNRTFVTLDMSHPEVIL